MMVSIMNIIVVYGFLVINLTLASKPVIKQTVHDYMNTCLKGMNHKVSPGPESELAFQCSPWVNRSCCTAETAVKMHKGRRWLNFDWDHCKSLSPRCREHFMQDMCFYECSPNVGPWLFEDVRKIRQERFKNVPLCQSECNNWWEACKDDFTCVEKWDKHFNWSTGINTCPFGTTCKPFNEVFTDGKHFCESIFGSFNVVPDAPRDCFHLWFDPKHGNPNEKVARKKASALLGVPYQIEKDKNKNEGGGSMSNYFISFVTFILCIPVAYII